MATHTHGISALHDEDETRYIVPWMLTVSVVTCSCTVQGNGRMHKGYRGYTLQGFVTSTLFVVYSWWLRWLSTWAVIILLCIPCSLSICVQFLRTLWAIWLVCKCVSISHTTSVCLSPCLPLSVCVSVSFSISVCVAFPVTFFCWLWSSKSCTQHGRTTW